VLGRPHDRRLTGREGEMVFNASYLVAREDAGTFAALVHALDEEHARAGRSVELTGPWPPYHFVGSGAGADGRES